MRRNQPLEKSFVGGSQFWAIVPLADGEREGRIALRATVSSTTNAQKQGASRFARYLLARDKGLSLLFWVSQHSNYRQLLSRLCASLSRLPSVAGN